MAISYRFICALFATLTLSSAALSQPTNGPSQSPAAAPGLGDNVSNRIGPASDKSRPIERGPSAQQPSSGNTKEPSSQGTGPDPTTVQESPAVTGNGTAGGKEIGFGGGG